MRHRLRTRAGKRLYKLRQQTVEPVFGIIKRVMGFGQFRSRGREKVSLEWTLICLAYNLKRLHRLCPGLKRAMASWNCRGGVRRWISRPGSGGKAGESGWRNCPAELNRILPTLQRRPTTAPPARLNQVRQTAMRGCWRRRKSARKPGHACKPCTPRSTPSSWLGTLNGRRRPSKRGDVCRLEGAGNWDQKNCADSGSKAGPSACGRRLPLFPKGGQQGASCFGATGIPPAPRRLTVTSGAQGGHGQRGAACRGRPESCPGPVGPSRPPNTGWGWIGFRPARCICRCGCPPGFFRPP
ncbi:transposase [Limisphaera ngatamarikiensis]|uniref:Transposase n=1 Tax=Limisphaera ngatamarikiensis TaxID=1324935 RepID=A0A6M1RKX8_9BACT|nr:transposase [Limisphaera ngatamarikiensis]